MNEWLLGLQDMFDKQVNLQNRLGNDIISQDFYTIQSLALIDEVMEALRETSWKPWKQVKPRDKDKLKEEIVDIWHFLINLTLSAGFKDSKELYELFMAKNKTNHKRQDDGY